MRVEWILALVELAGILIACVKAVLMIGKTLKTIEKHDEEIKDLKGRTETVESFLMNLGAHK